MFVWSVGSLVCALLHVRFAEFLIPVGSGGLAQDGMGAQLHVTALHKLHRSTARRTGSIGSHWTWEGRGELGDGTLNTEYIGMGWIAEWVSSYVRIKLSRVFGCHTPTLCTHTQPHTHTRTCKVLQEPEVCERGMAWAWSGREIEDSSFTAGMALSGGSLRTAFTRAKTPKGYKVASKCISVYEYDIDHENGKMFGQQGKVCYLLSAKEKIVIVTGCSILQQQAYRIGKTPFIL